jgi:hypothetical protein
MWWFDARKALHRLAARVTPGSCPCVAPVKGRRRQRFMGDASSFTASIKAQLLRDIHVNRRFHLILKHGDKRLLLWRIARVLIALSKWCAMARTRHVLNLRALSTRIKRR